MGDNASSRAKQHAKVFEFRGRQVLAFLTRNLDDRLQMIVQMWLESTDEQVQVALKLDDVPVETSDHFVTLAFESICTENVEAFFNELGLIELLREFGEQI